MKLESHSLDSAGMMDTFNPTLESHLNQSPAVTSFLRLAVAFFRNVSCPCRLSFHPLASRFLFPESKHCSHYLYRIPQRIIFLTRGLSAEFARLTPTKSHSVFDVDAFPAPLRMSLSQCVWVGALGFF
jgi:hypothetical protein